MAGSVNKVLLVCRLGRDPEIRNTQSGDKIVNLTVATGNSWNDKQTGERRECTDWHRVVIYNQRLADIAEKFLTKGRLVHIEGELRTRKWTDQQGVEKYTTEVVLDRFRGEIVLLDNKPDGTSQHPSQPAQKPQATNQAYGSNRSMSDAAGYDLQDDEEIPF